MSQPIRNDDVMRYFDSRFQVTAAKLLPTQYLAVDDVFVRAIITHVAVGGGSAQGKPRSGGRAGSTGSSSRSRPCRSS